jgi:formylglycine-generating enzyme required for sulfatase activity
MRKIIHVMTWMIWTFLLILGAVTTASSEMARADEACNGGILVATGLANTPLCITPGSGQSFRDCPDCPEMVVLPAGSFEMGAAENEPDGLADEVPQHKVIIGAPFAVGQFSITVREYLACVSAGACNPPAWQVKGSSNGEQYEQLGNALTDDDYPIVGVSWNGAKKYTEWLSAKTGKNYRLSTEAEFEYAARAKTTTPFWWGSSISPDQANYKGFLLYDGGGKKGVDRQKTVPVKSFAPNPWGLYQVHGNVWEWVEDCWHANYNEDTSAPGDGSAWIKGSAWIGGECKARVLRGGAWDSPPFQLRSAFRNYDFPTHGTSKDGFRVARTLTP